MSPKKIRVVLADDHTILRKGLKSLIESLVSNEVVGEACDGEEALVLIRDLKPDVVLMDISMPNRNGLDATARAVQQSPSVPIIILSMHAGKEYVIEALRAGASGFLLKNCEIDELNRAIASVVKGGKYLTPAVSNAVVEHLLTVGNESDISVSRPLSARQKEILQLLATGLSNRDIAERLSLSVKTVETHRMQLTQRLNIHTVAGLTRYAIRAGLINPDA